MAAPKTLKRLAGDDVNLKSAIAVPVDPEVLAVAVDQLQATVNALIVQFNLHQHSALNAAPAVGAVDGTVKSASGLFTPPAQ